MFGLFRDDGFRDPLYENEDDEVLLTAGKYSYRLELGSDPRYLDEMYTAH